MNDRDRLVCFLYVLARDHLPTGSIEGILAEHVERGPRERSYSSPQLEALAREWADRLVGDP